MTKLHIDEVCSKDSTYPLIANFLHGNPTDKFQIDECLLLKRQTNNNSNTVLTKVENLLYIGDEERDGLSKTFIVKRNKSTGKVQILEAGVVNLKPVINVNKVNIEAMEVSNLELSRKFGSKKARKYLEQRDKLKVNVETVTEQMKNVTQEISQDTLDLSMYDLANSDEFYIPKMDRTAIKPDDVYKVEDMITETQCDKILSELRTKDCTSDFLPFTKGIMTKKNLSEKETVSLVYADALLRLYNTSAKDIGKKNFVICPHSSTLNSLALANFTSMSNGKRVRSTPFKDRTLCHAIVHLLLLNNLKIDLDSLSEAVKLSPMTLATKARVTGSSIVTVDSKKIIQLKFPLSKSTFRRKSAKF